MFVFESTLVTVITGIITFLICLYLFLTRHFNFWKKRHIPYVRPLPFFGNLKDVLLQKKHIGNHLKDIYDNNKDTPFIGIFAFDQPALLVRDLKIMKNILVKDSRNFIDRMVKVDESLSPLNANAIFALRGQKWKQVRTNLTPTFTSGKMKNMFFLVDKCGQQLVLFLETFTDAGNTVPVKDAMERFTTDVIAMCAFGIESNSLQDPKAEFSSLLHQIFKFSFARAIANLATFFAPWVQNVFRLKLMDNDVEDKLRDIVWKTVHLREKTGEKRKDFLDFLMELRTSGTFNLDGDDFVAQAFAFLLAGFHTASMTLTFILYELSVHPDIQTSLRDEINEVLEKYNKEVTYFAIKEMRYLDMVLNESLRKYPAIPFLDRKCQEDYSFSPDFKLPAGTGVYIPVYALHHDPTYFPNPEKFDPKRFTDKNKQNIPHFAYMPFGEGPRNCIGMRFGLMQVKTALIHILAKFEVSPCKKTQIPLIVDPKPFNLMALGEVYLTITKLNH